MRMKQPLLALSEVLSKVSTLFGSIIGVQAGVVADGVTDNTAVIRAAMLTASAVTGYTVLLPPGDIKVVNLIPVPGVWLRGAGIGKTRLIGIGSTGTVIDISNGGWLEDFTLVSGGSGQMAIKHLTTGVYRRDVVRRVRMEGFIGERGLKSNNADGLLLDQVEGDGSYIPIHIETPVGVVDIIKPRLTNSAATTMCYAVQVSTPTNSPIVTTATVRIYEPYVRGANRDSTGYSAEAWGIVVTRVLNVLIVNPDIQGCKSLAVAPNIPGRNPSGEATGGGILLGSRSWGSRVIGGDVIRNRVNIYIEEQPEGGAAGRSLQADGDLGVLVDGTHVAYADGPGISGSYGVTATIFRIRSHHNGQDGIVGDSDFFNVINCDVYDNWQDRSAAVPQLVRAGIRNYGRFGKITGNSLYDTQTTKTQDWDIAVAENSGHRIGGNTGQGGNGSATLYEGTNNGADGLTPNLFLDADVYGNWASYLGTLVQQNNPATAMYYPIGTLPTTASSDPTKITVSVRGGSYTDSTEDRFTFGSLGAFKAFFLPNGLAATRTNLSPVVYRNADNTFSVYAKVKAGAYAHGNVHAVLVPAAGTTTNSRNRTRPLPLGAATSTVPSGTLIFDGSDPAYLPVSSTPASVLAGSVLQQNAGASPLYALLTTLPAGNATLNRLDVELLANQYNGADSARRVKLILGNFNNFGYEYSAEGTGAQTAGLACYKQADNTVQVYVKTPPTIYTYSVARATLALGSVTSAVTPGSQTSTVPSGTLVLDTTDPVTYPANATLQVGNVRLRVFTQATLPAAASSAGLTVYLSDPPSGNSNIATSDGTNWIYQGVGVKEVSGTTAAAAANLDLVVPTATGFLRRITTSTPCTVAVYATSADRAADANRLDTTPTNSPTTPSALLAQVTTVTGALKVALGVPYNQSTLYLRVSAAATVTVGVEDA